jgi:hypothetical protein
VTGYHDPVTGDPLASDTQLSILHRIRGGNARLIRAWSDINAAAIEGTSARTEGRLTIQRAALEATWESLS